ncbi:MAG TPA: SpoIID/LytB domain-containing protein, partial [Thermoanaerobaculia bacterium]|nr:SpoIID/LytB domain-containing protein [Thermoanaerobaculia bacterium]
MKFRLLPALMRLPFAAAALAVACAAPAPAPPAPLPSTPEAPLPIPAVRVAPPVAAAPSGVLYRVGLKSDLGEFVAGTPGTVWVVVSGDRAELVQGPLAMRPSGGAHPQSFQIQAGAFSQEDPARKLADKLAAAFQTSGEVAFSADRGLYRALVGAFESRSEADAFLAKMKAGGQDGFVVPGAPRASAAAPSVAISGGSGPPLELPAPVDVFAPAPDVRVSVDGVAYRGSLRIAVNPRGLLNVVNRVDLEEYLYGVVPAEMGPKRFDAIEGLKAQAVAARTYAMAHRGQFESEGYDLCPGPKCQAYGGASLEDPLSTAAVDGTRGLVLAFQGQFADALFVSTCGGVTENVENVFSGGPVPYLVSVPCSELPTEEIAGAAVPRDGGQPRGGLAWRGYVLRRRTPKKAAPRAAGLETAQGLAGVPRHGAPPSSLAPAAVYPSLITDFGLTEARVLHLTPPDERYYAEAPSAVGGLTGSARSAYEFLLRFRFAGDLIPPADRELSEEEYGGLLLSTAIRLMGVTEGSGKFLSREGSNLWVKTSDGRQGLPVDPDVPLARRIGALFTPTGSLTLRPGDRLRWLRSGNRVLALWVELEADGPEAERDSAWTEWVRRVPARELARRMAGRIAGNEVREITVIKRSPSGRAIEMRVKTDLSEAVFKRFDLRQAVEMPEMLFTVS